MPEKNTTAENAAKTTKKSAKKTPAKKAAKKSAAPKAKKTAEKKTSKRAGRAERLSAEQITAKRDEMKKILTGTAGMTPKDLKGSLKVNANQLRRILGGCDGVEKIGTSGPSVKYKLAG